MLTHYKKHSNLGAAVFIAALVTFFIFPPVQEEGKFRAEITASRAAFEIAVVAWFFAMWGYAKAKGQSGLVGIFLGFLGILGPIILLLLKDKHKETPIDAESIEIRTTNWKLVGQYSAIFIVIGVIFSIATALFLPSYCDFSGPITSNVNTFFKSASIGVEILGSLIAGFLLWSQREVLIAMFILLVAASMSPILSVLHCLVAIFVVYVAKKIREILNYYIPMKKT